MREGSPSLTAQRVAAYRLGFERIESPLGKPDDDDRLAADVAGAERFEPNEAMERYLRARTSFFDRVVVNALDRGTGQVVMVGAGYDGRALRYARPGVRWFEVDHPDTQRDKRERLARLAIEVDQVVFVPKDLSSGGLADSLVRGGFDPDATSIIICEGVAGYLDPEVLQRAMGELRSITTVGSRLALSRRTTPAGEDTLARRARLESRLAEIGEPVVNHLSPEGADAVLESAHWQPVELSPRARQVGFVVAAPVWAPPDPGSAPMTRGRVGRFMESVFHRRDLDRLGDHLSSTYGIEVASTRQLDVGVVLVELDGRRRWIARVLPSGRPLAATAQDAAVLRVGEAEGLPSERLAHSDPISVHSGQAVMVTVHVPGRRPSATPEVFAALGGMLGRLQALSSDELEGIGSGGASHHIACRGGPRQELDAALDLFDAAGHRVPASSAALFEDLRARLASLDDFGDLPHGLAHPDPVPANLIVTERSRATVLVDWTGAGRAPRVAPLGFLLWAADAKSPGCIDAVAAAYREHVDVQTDELDRLPDAIFARPFVLDVWSFATGRISLDELAERTATNRATALAVASSFRSALR